MISKLHLWLDELDGPSEYVSDRHPAQVLERPVARESAWSRIGRRWRSGRPARDPAGTFLRIPLLDPDERARDSER